MSFCERYHTTINCIVNHRKFLVNNIDRFADNELETASDDVNVLRELLYCREGTFDLSNSSFSHYDVEQFIISVCTC